LVRAPLEIPALALGTGLTRAGRGPQGPPAPGFHHPLRLPAGLRRGDDDGVALLPLLGRTGHDGRRAAWDGPDERLQLPGLRSRHGAIHRLELLGWAGARQERRDPLDLGRLPGQHLLRRRVAVVRQAAAGERGRGCGKEGSLIERVAPLLYQPTHQSAPSVRQSSTQRDHANV